MNFSEAHDTLISLKQR